MKEMILLFLVKAIEPAGLGQISGLVHLTGCDGTVEDRMAISFGSGMVLVQDIPLGLSRDFIRQEAHHVFCARKSSGQDEMSHQDTPHGKPLVIQH